MRQLIITKETLAALSALRPGKEVAIELTDRDLDEPKEDRRDQRVSFRVQGLVGGGVALFEPKPGGR